MLPKSQRLNLKKEFNFVSHGATIKTSLFRVFVNFGQNANPKVGVAINSQSFPKAAKRNSAKRISFQALGAIYQSLPKNVNIIVLPQSRALEVKLDDLISDLAGGLKKLNVLN